MTIALGILASGGLVVAADTEESDGYLKTLESKIRVSTQTDLTGSVGRGAAARGVPTKARQSAASAIAGAGRAGYIDALTPVMWGPCLANSMGSDETFISEVGRPLGEFYREHIIPFGSYAPLERPEVELLLAVTHRDAAPQDQHRVFVTDLTTVRRRSRFAAIGVGGMFAQMLLKRLYPVTVLDIGAATALAAYVAFQVKESVPGCGKFTEIVVLSKGTRAYVPWIEVREMETVFLQHAGLEAAAIACALAPDDEGATRALKDLGASFRKFRKAFGKLRFARI